jgi:uncharacterized protein YijF (DUF1287 family)
VHKSKIIIFSLLTVLLVAVLLILNYFNLLPKKTYSAEDFGFDTILSSVDFNDNGIDDYTDILLGARADAENHPTYDGSYYVGGYPPDDIGVCTDVIWRAFKHAGYSLRDMVDNDIISRPDAYKEIKKRDINIDFRRVRNLRTFFGEFGVSLTHETEQIEEWQPGDIVIFGDNEHIGIVSDKRNRKGQPYIIHNGGQPNREEDILDRAPVTGHYRFDASQIDSDVLVGWN